MTQKEEALVGELRALQFRENYVTALVAKIKDALGDAQMPDDEVEAAVLAAMQNVARVRGIAAYLKKMVLDVQPVLLMRIPDVWRELKETYPEWEIEV